MRHHLCSVEIPARDERQARQRTHAAAELFELPPLQSVCWSEAVSKLAVAPHWQAAEASLGLWLETGSAEDAGPRLVAELLVAEFAEVARPRAISSDIHCEVLRTGGADGAAITLAVKLPPQKLLPTPAQIDAWGSELGALEAPDVAADHEQMGSDLSLALAALEEERAAHSQARLAHEAILAQLAHDLRSPLLTLNLSLEMLRIKPHDAEALEARREVMKRQADELRALAASLLGNITPGAAASAVRTGEPV